jgi:tetratricopeptide (TPR) repeat protein
MIGAVINLLIGLFGFWPTHIRLAPFGKIPSDGLLLATIPNLSEKQLRERHANYFYLEGSASQKRKRYDEARAWLEQGLSLYPDMVLMRFLLGHCLVPLEEFALSRKHLLPLAERQDLAPALRFLILDTIAWNDLMLGHKELIPEAFTFSLEALTAEPWSPAFKGTHGAVLVELGEFDAGLDLLKKALAGNKDAYNKAVNACYLALGEHRRGNQQESQHYLAMARQLDPKCPVLDRIESQTSAEVLEAAKKRSSEARS